MTFENHLQTVEGKPPAEVLSPGHPLLAAVIEVIINRFGALLQDGAVLVDPDDPGVTPRALVYLEHTLSTSGPSPGDRRPLSRRHQFVEIPRGGRPADAGYAPHLDYRPLDDPEVGLVKSIVDEEWIDAALTSAAGDYAIEYLADAHYREIQRITDARISKVRSAVKERLEREIHFWDSETHRIRDRELTGKGAGGFSSGHARNRADQLHDRLKRRLAQLDRELDVSNHPPSVVGGALIIPQGLLDQLSAETPPITDFLESRAEIDRRAVAAVLAAERRLGRDPTEMAHHNPGYDIESRDPESKHLYFIEVKGRIEDADTVNVKARQIRQAQNNPDRFILALVLVPADQSTDPAVHYVRAPFQGMQVPFDQYSVNLPLHELLPEAASPS